MTDHAYAVGIGIIFGAYVAVVGCYLRWSWRAEKKARERRERADAAIRFLREELAAMCRALETSKPPLNEVERRNRGAVILAKWVS